MCLAALAWNVHPLWRAVIIANRDEFHARPTAPLHSWSEPSEDKPGTEPAPWLAGRDLQAGGTWFGLAHDRRFGLITNFREPARAQPEAPTRGRLIPDYLRAPHTAERFLATIAAESTGYAGFNLLLADGETLWYASNRATPFAQPLARGVHALSNHLLDTPWPKLRRLRGALEHWVAADTLDLDPLWAALADRQLAHPDELPSTGVTREWEHRLSAPFVQYLNYGTRSSSVLLLGHDGRVHFEERSFDTRGEHSLTACFTLPPEGWVESGQVASRKLPTA